MNTKIKNIIFDLGGVILDIDETVVYKELEKLGISTSELAHSKDFIDIMSKFDTGIYTAPTFRRKMKALIGQEKMTDQRFDAEQHQRNPLRPLRQGLAAALRLQGV